MASRLATKTLLKVAETLEKRKERREERKAKNNSTTTVDAGIGNYTSTSTGVTVGGTTPSQSTPSSIGTSTSSSSSSSRGGKKSTLLTPTSGATANQTSTAQPTPTAREVLISGKTGRPSGRTTKDYTNINPQQTTIQQNPPTIEEINRRNKLNENILTADVEYVQSTSNRYKTELNNLQVILDKNEKVVKNIEDLDNLMNKYNQYLELNDKGEYVFTGTKEQFKQFNDYQLARQSEYEKYLDLQEDYEISKQKIEAIGGKISDEGMISEPTIKVGLGKYTIDTPISRYSNLKSETALGVTAASLSVLTDTVAATKSGFFKETTNIVGSSLGKSNENGNVIWRNPSKVTTTTSERIGTQYFVPQGTIQNGKTTPYTQQVFIPEITTTNEKKQITTEDLGKGYFNVISQGKYLIPWIGETIFAGEVTESVKESGGLKKYIKEKPLEAALIGGGLFFAGTLRATKGYRTIKNQAIEDAINIKLKELSNVEIKSLKIIDEGSGKVSAVGYREVEGVTQEVRYYGEIKKTERGVEFIPEGVIGQVTSGVVNPRFILGMDNKPRAFIQATTSEFGSRGTNIFLRNIGDARVYESLGTTTSRQLYNYFGIQRLDKLRKKGINLVEQKINKDIYKDFSLPLYKDRNLFIQLNENVGLTSSNREIGTVLFFPELKLYHGTTESAFKSIKKFGLKGKQEARGLDIKDDVFLTTDLETAKGWANSAVVMGKLKGKNLGKPIVLEVKMTEEEFSKALKEQFGTLGNRGELKVKEVSPDRLKLLSEKKSKDKINLPSLDFKIQEVKLTTEDKLPRMVGGTGVTTSLYAGEGLYERTESTSVMKLPSFNEEIKIANIKVTQDIKPIESEITKSKSKGKSRTLEITKPIELTKVDEVIKPIFKEKQLPIQKEKFGQLQVQRLAQALKQVQQSKNVLFTPNIKISLPTKQPKLAITKKQKSGTEFEAVGFRFGKPVSLGKFEEKRVASKELKEFLSSTLGASGYLKFGEKKLKAEETGLLEEFGFRKSKTGNKFLVVEEKPLRLRRGNSTGKQIQAFRFR